jgi:hypothetical protein
MIGCGARGRLLLLPIVLTSHSQFFHRRPAASAGVIFFLNPVALGAVAQFGEDQGMGEQVEMLSISALPVDLASRFITETAPDAAAAKFALLASGIADCVIGAGKR